MREAILKVRSDGRLVWRRYSNLREVLSTTSLHEVEGVLESVEQRANKGHACVGWVAYEAASALNPALQTHAPKPRLPLVHFGVFAAWENFEVLPFECPERLGTLDWRPDVEPSRHAAAIARIRGWIAAGDTYQVNFTHRLHATGSAAPEQLFESMSSCPRTAYSAFIETDQHAICCASPELFFELDGDTIRTSPMKGTAPRGLDTRDDARLAAALAGSEKDRAENLMILDMARNDLGKIAEVGSVRVVEPFKIERFATLHQMTSTAEATTRASLTEIFRALFPAASMTGAPKRRTMEIIRELESSQRGVYSGCVGVVEPGRRARFGVAIRTAVLDKAEETWEYGVGGGIVWDSNPESELRETQTKAAVLTSPRPDFKLIETLRWSRSEGFALLEEHLARLMDSASYFDWQLAEGEVRRALGSAAEAFEDEAVVRLTIGKSGELDISSRPSAKWPADRPIRIAAATFRLDPNTLWTRHKTDQRRPYDEARAEHPGCDEVLLLNTRNELADGSISNVAVCLDGAWITPPLESGALPGVLRAELLEMGALAEAPIPIQTLGPDALIKVFNSVRGISQPTSWKDIETAILPIGSPK